jgi:hypothetical protein
MKSVTEKGVLDQRGPLEIEKNKLSCLFFFLFSYFLIFLFFYFLIFLFLSDIKYFYIIPPEAGEAEEAPGMWRGGLLVISSRVEYCR